jgi:hypothetical protein
VRIVLNDAGRRVLRQARSVPLRLQVRIASPGRRAVTSTRRVSLGSD